MRLLFLAIVDGFLAVALALFGLLLRLSLRRIAKAQQEPHSSSHDLSIAIPGFDEDPRHPPYPARTIRTIF